MVQCSGKCVEGAKHSGCTFSEEGMVKALGECCVRHSGAACEERDASSPLSDAEIPEAALGTVRVIRVVP